MRQRSSFVLFIGIGFGFVKWLKFYIIRVIMSQVVEKLVSLLLFFLSLNFGMMFLVIGGKRLLFMKFSWFLKMWSYWFIIEVRVRLVVWLQLKSFVKRKIIVLIIIFIVIEWLKLWCQGRNLFLIIVLFWCFVSLKVIFGFENEFIFVGFGQVLMNGMFIFVILYFLYFGGLFLMVILLGVIIGFILIFIFFFGGLRCIQNCL